MASSILMSLEEEEKRKTHGKIYLKPSIVRTELEGEKRGR
jgi:hypothetical protein